MVNIDRLSEFIPRNGSESIRPNGNVTSKKVKENVQKSLIFECLVENSSVNLKQISQIVTLFAEDNCIWDLEYTENISLRELHLLSSKSILCYTYYYMTVLCCLFFSFFLFSLFVLFLSCFSLMLFVNVHRISILPSLCPNNSFFFFSKFFLWLLFLFSDLYIITTIFLNAINLSLS